MKRLNYVCLVLSLASLLLLTACGGQRIENTVPDATAVHKIEGPKNPGLKTVDAGECISVSFSGLDTLGNAEVSVDFNALAEQVFDGDYTDADVADLADYYFSIYPKAATGLSNGDTFVVNINDDLDIYDCRVKETELSYTVSGLEEMKTVNVFEGLVLTYEGTCPYVKATATNPSMDLFIQSIDYEVEPLWFNEGDTVTVRALYSEETAERYGCVAEEVEYQFVAEGLSYFIRYPEEVSEDCATYMLEAAPSAVSKVLRDRAFELSQIVVPDQFISPAVATCTKADPTGEMFFFQSKENQNACVIIPYEISYTLYEDHWDGKEEICSGTIYMGVVFSSLRVDYDGTISAGNFGNVKYADLIATEFELTEDAIYEKLLSEYREKYICYEPVPFPVNCE